MKPMLARTLGPKFNQFPCFVQPKLNGVRALYQDGELFEDKPGVFQSRDEKVWNHSVLKHLHDELKLIKSLIGDLILDGELYVHGWRLQRINGAVAVNRKEPNEDTPHVEFHVFDVVNPNRKFSDRWFDLYTPLTQANLPHIKAVPTALCTSRADVDFHFYNYTHLGYEGIMLRPDGLYEFGEHEGRNGPTSYRSKTLWKYKQWEDNEFWCVGVEEGVGKREGKAGALLLGSGPTVHFEDGEQPNWFPKMRARFKVGTGFDDAEAADFLLNPPIGKLIRIRYLNLTADGIPFNPSFLAVLD